MEHQHRRQSLPAVPGTLRELAEQFRSGLLDIYQSCDELMYKGCVEDTLGDYSIVFASKTLIIKTRDMEITEIHVDPTFRVVPSTPKCCQLLTMHAMVNNHSIPIVYVLMEHKTSQAYDAVLHFVKVNLLAELRPSVILTDFETALREMLIKHFPSATAHGSWFHTNQAIWRKLQKLDYIYIVNSNEFATKIVEMIMVLPLLPAGKIEEGFVVIKRYAAGHNINMLRLFNYYERYWIRNVGIELLSVYEKKFRTNNNIEEFHSKLREIFQDSQPNIWSFLAHICKINDTYSVKLDLINNGLMISLGPRSKYLANDEEIKTASHQLRQGKIDIKTFLLQCSDVTYVFLSSDEQMQALAINDLFGNEGGEDPLQEEQFNIIDGLNEEEREEENFELLPRSIEEMDETAEAGLDDDLNEEEREEDYELLQRSIEGMDETAEAGLDDNEEDFIIPEDTDPDMMFMMELEARNRQLELENIPFVQVPSILPSLNDQDSKCIICTDAERTHALIPCGHKILCFDCLNLLDPKRCPVCNEYFTNFLRIW